MQPGADVDYLPDAGAVPGAVYPLPGYVAPRPPAYPLQNSW